MFDIDYEKEFDTYNMTLRHSFFFEKFPIKKARYFLQRKDEVILSSTRKHLLFFDLQKEKSEILPNVFFHKKLGYKNNCVESFELNKEGSFMAFYNEKNNGMIGLI